MPDEPEPASILMEKESMDSAGIRLAPTSRLVPLAPETPVELIANGESIAILMCTPLNLDDLAVGHLFSRGMLSDPSRVLSIGACADLRVMSIIAPGAIGADRFGLGQVVASGCGSGPVSSCVAGLDKVPAGLYVSMAYLKACSRSMFESAALYKLSGGMHCAALALPAGAAIPSGAAAPLAMELVPNGASYFVVREDVGRHNAVDKILGRGFVDRVDFSSACVLTSGRVAADMLLKAVAARVPVIASRSIPTTTAFEMAEALGVTVVGRIGDDEPIVYTHPERIRL